MAAAAAAGGPLDDLIGRSITYRVAVGPRAGQKVFSLQTVPAREDEPRKGVAQYAGFSLHAGIGVEAEQRAKLERLTRYVSRPLDFIARLAALVPPPRVHLTRFHAAHPCAAPFGQPAAVQIGNPADLSWSVRRARGAAGSDHAGRKGSRGATAWRTRGVVAVERCPHELGETSRARLRHRD
jgi:hypothetical protein